MMAAAVKRIIYGGKKPSLDTAPTCETHLRESRIDVIIVTLYMLNAKALTALRLITLSSLRLMQ